MKFLKQLLYSGIATGVIVLAVFALFLFGAIPYSPEFASHFLIGAGLLVVGQAIFLMAIDQSIIKLGKLVGTELMKKRNVWIIVLFGFLFGLVTTIAEPDVQVLVSEIVQLNPFLSTWALMSICGIGCGLFVCFGLVRILKNISLKWLLFALYALIILLSCFVPDMYIGIAFDMGGVTTGSVTVPFILALATGICAIRGKSRASDTFGVIAIASIGPILAMLILGLIVGEPSTTITQTVETAGFLPTLLTSLGDVALAFLPMLVIFIIAQFTMLKLSWSQVLKILLGFILSALGLVVFLTGIYFGFTSMGLYIGQAFMMGTSEVIIILFGVIVGCLFVFTDPSIVVVVGQVEEITSGLLKKKVVFITLGIGISMAVALALIHVLFEVHILYFLVPIVLASMLLNFFIPKIFMALAFDSGGVASGTMTVAFIFPICVGLMQGGGEAVASGFGMIGIVATVPILAMQVLGLVFRYKQYKLARRNTK